MSIWQLNPPRESEFQRGYSDGKKAIAINGYDRSLKEWEECGLDDAYDNGFKKALDDHEEFQRANAETTGDKDPDH